MSKLSISRAWDETKATIARDGRLITAVALAMVALPSAIAEFVNPSTGLAADSQGLAGGILTVLVALIGLVGQLSIIRLVVGPAVSVGAAIGHGARRAVPYIGATILILIGFVLLAIPFVAALMALGMDFEPPINEVPGAAWLVLLLFMAVALVLAVRLLMSSPVASTEDAGPITIVRRSWALTAGHTGRLLGFLCIFLLAAGIAMVAISSVTGLIAGLLLGPVEPLNLSALFIALVSGLAGAAVTVLLVVMITRMYLQLVAGSAEASVPSSRD